MIKRKGIRNKEQGIRSKEKLWTALFLVPSSLLFLPFLFSSAHAADFYVSPTGTSSNNGTISSPWDIHTALSHPASVQPGDTIWVRGGTYRGPIRCELNGTSTSPIIVRRYQNERPVIDGASAVSPTTPMYSSMGVFGTYTWIWGLEFTNSDTRRIFNNSECWENQHCRASAVDVFGSGTKLINSVVYDAGTGFGFWSAAQDTEAYGNIVYYVGWQSDIRGSGHGMYAQNQTGIKRMTDNIVFKALHSGFHIFGGAGAFLQNFVFDGNIIFNNGLLAEDPNGWGILVGGTEEARDITLRNNYLFIPDNYSRGSNLNPSYRTGVTNLTLENNYSAGFVPIGYTAPIEGALSASGNTFVGPVGSLEQSQISSVTNAFHASGSGLPNRVYVRPNVYEPGRAHIAIYNWQALSSVVVDLSASGLQNGMNYEIRDVENYFGPAVFTGTYNSASPNVSLPMNLTAVSPTVGVVPTPPVHTSTEFGVFVVIPGASTPPPPSDTTAPSVPGNVTWAPLHFTSMTLTWNASTDNVAVTGYRLDVSLNSGFSSFISGHQNLNVGNVLTRQVTGLSEGTTYYARLRAYDAAGNISGNSGTTQSVTKRSSSGPIPPPPFPPTVPPPTSLPTPQLNFPSVMSLQDELRFDYPAIEGIPLSYDWQFEPVGSTVAATQRPFAAPSRISARTSASRLIPAERGVTPGLYDIRVRAISSPTVESPQATARVSFAASDLNAVRVFPNPWRADRHRADPITFDNLSAGSEVKIFTVAAHFVRKLTASGATATWDLRNESGDSVASGIYIFLIKDASGSERKGKLAIVK